MSAVLEHKRSAVGMLQVCEADCPACAEQRRIDGCVREIVLRVWIQAIEAGECNVEKALRAVVGPISKMHAMERNRESWRFTRQALAAVARKKSSRKRGRPTAWQEATCVLVDLINQEEGRPLNHPENYNDTAFHRVAEYWTTWGMPATALDVYRARYPRRR